MNYVSTDTQYQISALFNCPFFKILNNSTPQQQPLEEVPAKKLRLTKPSKSAALHIDLCKATSPTDALQYLLNFARKPVEAESVEGVVRILLEHYYKVRVSFTRENLKGWGQSY